MHICFLSPQIEYYAPTVGGAIATGIMQKARILIARGHRVTVLAVSNGEPTYPVGEVVNLPPAERGNFNLMQRRLSALSMRLHRWDRRFYEHYKRSFMRALRGLQSAPDAVICHNDFVSPKYIKRAVPKAKVVVSLHNEQSTRRKDLSDTLPYVHRFVTNSDYIRRWTAQRHKIPLENLVVTLNGVDNEAFHTRPNFLEMPNPVRVLCLGRIDPNKGADIAADVIAILRHDGIPVRLCVAGDVWFYKRTGDDADPYMAKLKEKVQSVDGDYLGHVPRADVPALIRRHDVVCVLSRSNEPFGLVALEAMASGCAVIASNRGGLPEACDGAAWLVNVDNFDDVVSALRTLTTIPPVLNEYKRRSVQRAAKATWDQNVDALENVLQN
jgi:glycosyltransferase involved in cell wall biosynthesis